MNSGAPRYSKVFSLKREYRQPLFHALRILVNRFAANNCLARSYSTQITFLDEPRHRGAKNAFYPVKVNVDYGYAWRYFLRELS
jgi:hypothetical protein